MVRPISDIGRLRDHIGHADDHIAKALTDLEIAARAQQSATDRLKHAAKRLGWAGNAVTPQVAPLRKTGSKGPRAS